MENNSQGGQASAQVLARRLAAFVPRSLVQQLQSGTKPTPGIPHSEAGAALFADISGFTSMSEELAADGPRGAEELSRILTQMFDAMVNVIHRLGGTIGHYYGDAILVTFSDEDATAARRALACGQQLQELMRARFRQVKATRPLHRNPFFPLTIKIGVGYGRCHSTIVGDRNTGLELVVFGTAVTSATHAEKRALAGQLVAAQAALRSAGLPADNDYTQVTASVAAVPPAQPPTLPQGDRACHDLVACLRPFVPPALAERLALVQPVSLAEHRPATSIFVQFRFCPEQDTSPADHARLLDRYYRWATHMVAQYGTQNSSGYLNARVNRVLTGDKGNQLHLIFGAPVAPDAPEQALRCALALQRDMPDFIKMQQIGVAAGKVFAGPLGAQNRHEYTIVGDVVNLSARLAAHCPVGDVLTEDATAVRIRTWVDATAMAPITVKGKRSTVIPHRAERDRTLDPQLQAYFRHWERPLAGRGPQIKTLKASLHSALHGSGCVIAISGAVGVGKTRLLALGTQQWLAGGGTGQVGICQQHTRESPFAPWRNIWLNLLGIGSTMTTAEQADHIRQKTVSLVPDAGEDIPLWGELFSIPLPGAEALAELPAEVRRERFFRLARRCLQAIARAQPTLIILEAVHWADRASLDLLEALSKDIDHQTLCLIVSCRPGALSTGFLRRIADSTTAVTLTMDDLPPEQARDMLESLIGVRELPPAVEQHLGLRDREGRTSPVNPLFLEEALNIMVERGVLEFGGRMRVDEDRLATLPVPDNIHGLLLARLDGLPAPSRGLLQVASVIGRQFALDPLDSITPETPRDMVVALLSALTAEEFTQLIAADPEWIYLFYHAMTHEVAYESLPFARRQALHAAVADWIVDQFGDNLKPFRSMLAYHYGRANIHGEGLRYALEAAREARDLFANQEAIELYNLAERHLQALGGLEDWETAFDIWIERAGVLQLTGEFSLAEENVKHALDLLELHPDTQKQAVATNLYVELLYRQSRYQEACDQAHIVLEALGGSISSDELARAYQWLGMAQSRQMKLEPALQNLLQARDISLAAGNERRLGRVLEGIAFISLMTNDLQSALEAMRDSVNLTRDFDISTNLAIGLNNISFIESRLGLTEQALASINEAIPLARESSRHFSTHLLGNRGAILSRMGRFSEAKKDFAEALDTLAATDDMQGRIEVKLQCAFEFYAAQEQWHRAAALYANVGKLLEAQEEPSEEHRGRLSIGLGQLHLANGETGRAIMTLEAALAICEERSLLWLTTSCALFLARAYVAHGQVIQAQALLQKGVELGEGDGDPDYMGPLLIELAKLTQEPKRRSELILAGMQAAKTRIRYADLIQLLSDVDGLLASLATTDKDRLNHLHTVRQTLRDNAS